MKRNASKPQTVIILLHVHRQQKRDRTIIHLQSPTAVAATDEQSNQLTGLKKLRYKIFFTT